MSVWLLYFLFPCQLQSDSSSLKRREEPLSEVAGQAAKNSRQQKAPKAFT
jgi:hypothetical protein